MANNGTGWKDIPIGGMIVEAGNAVKYPTGNWRAFRPIWDEPRCIHCLQCWIMCPDSSIVVEDGKMIAKHDTGCAVKLYEGAIAAEEGFATARFFLANTLARDGKFKEASEHYERFLTLSPDDPAAGDAQKRLEACKANLSK